MHFQFQTPLTADSREPIQRLLAPKAPKLAHYGNLTISGECKDDEDIPRLMGDAYELSDRYKFRVDKVEYNGLDITGLYRWDCAVHGDLARLVDAVAQGHVIKLFTAQTA